MDGMMQAGLTNVNNIQIQEILTVNNLPFSSRILEFYQQSNNG